MPSDTIEYRLMTEQLTKLTEKTESVVEKVNDIHVDVELIKQDLEHRKEENLHARVRQLESWKAKSMGYLAAMSVTVGAVINIAMIYTKKVLGG